VNVGLIIIGDEILSGKRQDKHFAKIAELLGARGLRLSWVEYLGDDRERLAATFRRTMAAGDVVFSCGGIGNTPDDHTRQAVAAALGEAEAGALVWLGVMVTIMIEIGMLTPPVGMNLFVLVGITKHQVNLAQASIGALPYWLLLMLGLVLLTAMPGIATWLPSLSYK
jgi:hypothetical protein